MAKIVVDVEELRRMVDWFSMTGEDMVGTGRSLLRATSDARSYDGQYAPWVQALAAEADHDIHTSASELNNLGRQLGRVARAFEDADQALEAGDFAWALIMREMVERGEIPRGDWFGWRERIIRPPWISPEEWRLLTPEERRELVLEARRAYDAQNARIARMRTPPWENNPGWLWNVAGINPLLFGSRHIPDMEMAWIREYMNQIKLEYEQHWADFLENQSVYKFGVGDDLTEAFLIYMFGLEGAAQYGVNIAYSDDGRLLGAIAEEDQRILEDPKSLLEDLELISDDRNAQDIDLDSIPQFRGRGYGSNYEADFGVHYNLCGEITTAVTIGIDPVDALIKFDGVPGGTDILLDQSEGTNHADLTRLLGEYGWEGERVGNSGDPYPWRDNRGWHPKPDQVANHLSEGRAVIALVNLDTTSNFIEPVDNRSDATHWVSILQVVETREDGFVARIYNPYQSREEWLPFNQLVESWTPGPNYRAVIATPPEELQWLSSP